MLNIGFIPLNNPCYMGCKVGFKALVYGGQRIREEV